MHRHLYLPITLNLFALENGGSSGMEAPVEWRLQWDGGSSGMEAPVEWRLQWDGGSSGMEALVEWRLQ